MKQRLIDHRQQVTLAVMAVGDSFSWNIQAVGCGAADLVSR